MKHALARRRVIGDAAGERWFAEGRPVRRVHGDSSMFIGGIRALLLQSLHPLAMAARAGHPHYCGDPWGGVQRARYFLAVTTLGPAQGARAALPPGPPGPAPVHRAPPGRRPPPA